MRLVISNFIIFQSWIVAIQEERYCRNYSSDRAVRRLLEVGINTCTVAMCVFESDAGSSGVSSDNEDTVSSSRR